MAHKIRPFFGKRQLLTWLEQRNQNRRINEAIQIIPSLTNANPHQISKRTRKQQGLLSDEYLYGEMHLITFVKLMDICQPKEGEVFYDLGSGAGDVIFMADYCYPFSKCYGVELLDSLYNLSTEKRERFVKQANALQPEKTISSQFILGDFLQVDFSDADIIFINATAFKGATWDNLSKLLKLLKPGARIIVTSLELKTPEFKMIYGAHELMSWGYCSVRIYEHL